MGKETCEVCGCESELGVTEKHNVVPTEVTKQARIPESKIVRVCPNCHQELNRWYSTRVTDMAYNPAAKQFRAKSGLEMVKEYQSAFNSFVKYKKEQKRAD